MSDVAKNNKIKRLGIDLGTNSLGWALLEIDKEQEANDSDSTYAEITAIGVRIFNDSRNPKDNSSLAVERRKARVARRTIRRRKQRWHNLVREFNNTEGFTLGENEKNLDPYKLRSKALADKLEPSELARAIFHLGKRRGYQDVGELFAEDGAVESKDEKEEKNNLGLAHNNLTSKIEKTLGHSQYINVIPKRFNTTLKDVKITTTNEETKKKETINNDKIVRPYRDDYKKEFDAIRDIQEAHYPQLNWDKIRAIIFHQNPLRAGDRSACSCCMEKYKKRAYIASPSYERYRLISDLHNLKVKYNNYDRYYNELTSEQRYSLYDLISNDKRDVVPFVELEQLVILIKDNKKPIFNLASAKSADGGLKTLAHNNQLAKILGDDYIGLCQDEKEDLLIETMLRNMDPVSYAKDMIEKGFEKYSEPLKAFKPKNKNVGAICADCARQMTKYMLDGHKPHEANTFISKYIDEYNLNHLPYYGKILNAYTQKSLSGSQDEKDYGRIGNPTVHVALNQLRKVMNAIIAEYGKPDEIRIELGREIKLTGKKKKEYEKTLKDNTEANITTRKELEKLGLNQSTGNVYKHQLWMKQGGFCLYCGIPLSASKWSEIEMEHIIPRAQSNANGKFNLAVSCQSCNAKKGNNDPYTVWGHDVNRWAQIIERVKKAYPETEKVKGKKTGENIKMKLFQPNAIDVFLEGKSFNENQLTDNHYIARIATMYLERLYDDPRDKGNHYSVFATKGSITSSIRSNWDFNSFLANPKKDENNNEIKDRDGKPIYPKNREDHRHHTIDAIVIALMSNSLVKYYNNKSNDYKDYLIKAKEKNEYIEKFKFPCPISYNEVVKKIAEVIPSIKADHGINNALFEDTAYGLYNKKASEVSKKEFSYKDKFANLDLQTSFNELWQSYFVALCLEDNEIANYYDKESLNVDNLTNYKKYRHRLYSKKEMAFNKAKDEIFIDGLPKKVFKQIYHTRGQNSKEIAENGTEKITKNAIEIKRKKGSKEPFKAYKPDGYICVEIWKVPPKKKKDSDKLDVNNTINWGYEGVFISPAMAMERMTNEIKAKRKLAKYKDKSPAELENIIAKTIHYSNVAELKPHPQAKFVMQLFKKDIVRGKLSQKMMETIKTNNANIKDEELQKDVYMQAFGLNLTANRIEYSPIISSNKFGEWADKTKHSKNSNGHVFWDYLSGINKLGYMKTINASYEDFEVLEKTSLTPLGKIKQT